MADRDAAPNHDIRTDPDVMTDLRRNGLFEGAAGEGPESVDLLEEVSGILKIMVAEPVRRVLCRVDVTARGNGAVAADLHAETD